MIGKGNAGLVDLVRGQDWNIIAVAQVAHYFCSISVFGKTNEIGA
jgi:hypothetical protein